MVIRILALMLFMSTQAYAGKFLLNWTDNSSNEQGFKIYRSDDGKKFAFIGKTPENVETYTDTEIVEGEEYWYQVAAYNYVGESEPTNVVKAVALESKFLKPVDGDPTDLRLDQLPDIIINANNVIVNQNKK